MDLFEAIGLIFVEDRPAKDLAVSMSNFDMLTSDGVPFDARLLCITDLALRPTELALKRRDLGVGIDADSRTATSWLSFCN